MDHLTDAHKAFLTQLPSDGSWAHTSDVIANIERRFGANALRGFGKSGLVEGYYRERMKHRLTQKGIFALAECR